jgi:multidrug efflux pump subunit AcrB
VLARVEGLKGSLIPADVGVAVTRDYGATAAEKSNELLLHMGIAVFGVAILILLFLGWRESLVVLLAIPVTLGLTLLVFYLYGYTLNRITLFALIFSIGILVDDAIVVVENIVRHLGLPGGERRSFREVAIEAVNEVGNPTILATWAVIAAVLPMAFVSGLMGPYMRPIPIGSTAAMVFSLLVAFVVTPWAALRILRRHSGPGAPHGAAAGGSALTAAPTGTAGGRETSTPTSGAHCPPDSNRFTRLYYGLMRPLFAHAGRRWTLLAVVGLATAGSLGLVGIGAVKVKMLPFDNKSEFQVIVDMPAGTPLERTAAVLRELGAHLANVPEVLDWQAYAGTAAPINFNGLVRQYALRAGGEVGDLQVNLVDRAHRAAQSHAIAMRERPALQAIGRRHGANVKVVEVPPGPPVLAPIVAEIYGPEAEGRREVARAVRAAMSAHEGIVDVDDSTIADAPRTMLVVDRRKAAMLGVPQQAIVATLRAGLAGEAAAFLHDGSKYPAAATLQLPAERHGDLDALLQLAVRSGSGRLVPVGELVTVTDTLREQPVHHKDLLPVTYVFGDMAGRVDSPLYGMFAIRPAIAAIVTPGGGTLREYFVRQPDDPYRGYAIKWDGEWQITYETFRDMGAAYAVGLILIYLLVVAQFGSYLVPLIIMAPIPLTIVGVMPGHALLGAQFTATSMIGMIALAGIIVRNSILLVDFIRLELDQGVPLADAIVRSAATRAQPIVLTGLAAMLGAFFILDDPIFNGLAISLIFGILVSTLLTLVVIPILYYAAFRRAAAAAPGGPSTRQPSPSLSPTPRSPS